MPTRADNVNKSTPSVDIGRGDENKAETKTLSVITVQVKGIRSRLFTALQVLLFGEVTGVWNGDVTKLPKEKEERVVEWVCNTKQIC